MPARGNPCLGNENIDLILIERVRAMGLPFGCSRHREDATSKGPHPMHNLKRD